MTDEVSFGIRGKVWRYPGHAGWYFVNLDRRESTLVRKLPLARTVAWGYVRVNAKLGRIAWGTTLFPAKGGIYMIAIKAAVRKKENIQAGDTVRIALTIESAPRFPLDGREFTATEAGRKARSQKAKLLPASSRPSKKDRHERGPVDAPKSWMS